MIILSTKEYNDHGIERKKIYYDAGGRVLEADTHCCITGRPVVEDINNLSSVVQRCHAQGQYCGEVCGIINRICHERERRHPRPDRICSLNRKIEEMKVWRA